MNTLFGQIEDIKTKTKTKIRQRDYKRNRCDNCGGFPKIHRNNAGQYYVKCHAYCPHWGIERKTGCFNTPEEAVNCWNKNNQYWGAK